MLFDLQAFSEASVQGIPLVLFVLVLVQWLSEVFGLAGRQKQAAAMAVGLILGIMYQVSIKTPGDFAGWFAVAIYGIALGLLASGTWNSAKALVSKVLDSYADKDLPGDVR